MYQVTAIYEGVEIGFGEGDSVDYAIEECIDSIDSMYIENALNDIVLSFNGKSGYPNKLMLGAVYYKARQYF